MKTVLSTKELSVGYGKHCIVSGIDINIQSGKIITLIGPNGSGKSTVLKTIIKQLKTLGGKIFVLEKDLSSLKENQIAKNISIVMTQKIKNQELTCREIISSGRYQFTNRLGILSNKDKLKVEEAIKIVNAQDFAETKFSKISDGQKQRVMLARAICQETQIIVLDEPTSYLDLHYKLELIKIINSLAKNQNKTIIMSLHELDLVKMISDEVICLDGKKVVKMGSVQEIFSGNFIQKLYGLNDDEFDPKTCTLKVNLKTKVQVESQILSQNFIQKNQTKIQKSELSQNKKFSVSQINQFNQFNQKNQFLKSNKKAKIIMIQGTMSNAGKSFFVAGLCRVFKQDGFKVAPFKSQNMALNSFITKEGLEMGRAQVMQAQACGIEPIVCMNPILLKPTNDKSSQVIVNGEVLKNMNAKDYFDYKKNLIPQIINAFQKLEKLYDIIVIEGAGSPAEINLRKNDIVNMGLAELLGAPVVLVADIDRGGVFAQILGTIELLEKSEKEKVEGFVINKFRGDKSLLDSGIKMIEDKTQKKSLGVLPYLNIFLDDEDSLSNSFASKKFSLINLGVIKLPHISNFTDFAVFEQIENVSLHYIKNPRELEKMDLIFLPGSKNSISDLQWIKKSGIENAIKKFAKKKIVFGICGGFQMLGKTISDPFNVEEGGKINALNLLDFETELQKEKTRSQTRGTLPNLKGNFKFLSGKKYSGYEIHMGKTIRSGKINYFPKGAFYKNVAGTYIHGFFDDDDIALSLVKFLAEKKGVNLKQNSFDFKKFKDEQFDILASSIRKFIDMEKIYKILKEAKI